MDDVAGHTVTFRLQDSRWALSQKEDRPMRGDLGSSVIQDIVSEHSLHQHHHELSRSMDTTDRGEGDVRCHAGTADEAQCPV